MIDRSIADVALVTGWTFPVIWDTMTRRQVSLILDRAVARDARNMVAILDVVHGKEPGKHRDRLMRIATGESGSTESPRAIESGPTDPADPAIASRWSGFAAAFGDGNAAKRITMRASALRALRMTPPGGYANG
jgi:hypothetical protein